VVKLVQADSLLFNSIKTGAIRLSEQMSYFLWANFILKAEQVERFGIFTQILIRENGIYLWLIAWRRFDFWWIIGCSPIKRS